MTPDDGHVHDVVGVGLGPFNLGLAALAAPTDLDAVFFEQEPRFEWHGGMLIEGATLEVPFLADLVTLADPTSDYSYLNYLREQDRLYEFYFYETFHVPRREYDAYCRWVAESLDSTRFSRRVERIEDVGDRFRVVTRDPETGENHVAYARDVVVGVGSRPFVPEPLQTDSRQAFHTAGYLDRRADCLAADSITVVGSGQSAAEVFLDLLERRPEHGYRLDWLTRSDGFFPMEYSKLGLQHFTPEYIDYFHDLPPERRDAVRAEQDLLYKGIDPDTSRHIYDELYRQSIDADPDVGLLALTDVRELAAAGDRLVLDCHHRQTEESFVHESEVAVLGTGYHRPEPSFLAPLADDIARDAKGRYRVARDYRVEFAGSGRLFVQNADLHTHGVGAPDLGLGAYRNSVIVNRLLGREAYPEDTDTVFQTFDPEQFAKHAPTARHP